MTVVDLSSFAPDTPLLIESRTGDAPTAWEVILRDPATLRVTIMIAAPEPDNHTVLLEAPTEAHITHVTLGYAGKLATVKSTDNHVGQGYGLHLRTQGGRELVLPVLGLKLWQGGRRWHTLIDRVVDWRVWLEDGDELTQGLTAAIISDGSQPVKCGGVIWGLCPDSSGAQRLTARFKSIAQLNGLPSCLKDLPVIEAELRDASAVDRPQADAYHDGLRSATAVDVERLVTGSYFAITHRWTILEVVAPSLDRAVAYRNQVLNGRATSFLKWFWLT